MRQLILFLLITFILGGCAGPQDGVLSSLLMGGVILVIFIISITVHYLIKGAKLLVGITPEIERKKEKKAFKEVRKNYLNQISNDKKFVKQSYNQYINNHKKKYPESKYPKNKRPNANSYLSKSGWTNEKNKAIERIKHHELSKTYNRIQNLNDKEFVKLSFEKSGYSNYQIWADRWGKAKSRVDRNKYDKNIKLLKVKNYEKL